MILNVQFQVWRIDFREYSENGLPQKSVSLLYGGNRIIILPYLPEMIFTENKTEPRPLAR